MASFKSKSFVSQRLCAMILLFAGFASCHGLDKSFAGEYEEVSYEGTEYRVYIVSPEKVELFWKDAATGSPIRRFSKVQKVIEDSGRKVEFMMNAGIFEPDGNPSGLHVENGKEINPINLKDADGNFFLKPNGVFYVLQDGTAGILESDDYVKAKLNPKTAVQSGPLLVRKGQIHPQFKSDSSNHKHRNGVGIGKDGTLVFAITKGNPEQKKFPNLYKFAEFFISLGCSDALFLDGDISQMIMNPQGPIPDKNEFGAIFAVSGEPQIDERMIPKAFSGGNKSSNAKVGLVGTIVQEDGSPGVGLEIWYAKCDKMRVKGLAANSRTDKEGKFKIERFDPSANYDIEIFEESTTIPRLCLLEYKPDPENFKIVVPAPFGNSVEVVDADGKPVKDAKANLFSVDFNGRKVRLEKSPEFSSDESGKISLRFWSKEKHSYKIGKDSYQWAYMEYAPDSMTENHRIILKKGCVVKGKVVAPNSEPSKMSVYYWDGHESYATKVDKDMGFTFDTVPPGVICFTALDKKMQYTWHRWIKKDIDNEIVLDVAKQDDKSEFMPESKVLELQALTEKIDKLMIELNKGDMLYDTDKLKKLLKESDICSDGKWAARIVLEKYLNAPIYINEHNANSKPVSMTERCRLNIILGYIRQEGGVDIDSIIFTMLKNEKSPLKKTDLCDFLKNTKEKRVLNYLYKQLDDKRLAIGIRDVSSIIISILCYMSDYELPKRTDEEEEMLNKLKARDINREIGKMADAKLKKHLKDKGLVDADIDDKIYNEDDAIRDRGEYLEKQKESQKQ